MEKKGSLLIPASLLIALSLTFGGCTRSGGGGSSSKEAETASLTSGPESAPEEMEAPEAVRAESADRKVSVELTPGFAAMSEEPDEPELMLPEGYTFGAADGERQAYMLYASEPKADSGITDYDEYRDELVKAVREAFVLEETAVSGTSAFILPGSGLPGDLTVIKGLYYTDEDVTSSAEEVSRAESVPESMVSGAEEMAYADSFASYVIEMTKEVLTATPEGGVDGQSAASAAGSESEAEGPVRPKRDPADGIPVEIRLYTVEGARDYHQFMCWSSSHDAPALAAEFDTMVSSLAFAGEGLGGY